MWSIITKISKITFLWVKKFQPSLMLHNGQTDIQTDRQTIEHSDYWLQRPTLILDYMWPRWHMAHQMWHPPRVWSSKRFICLMDTTKRNGTIYQHSLCHCWWTSESPRVHVAKFYGRPRLIHGVLRATNIFRVKLIEIVILWVYYPIPFGFSLFLTLLGHHFPRFENILFR